MAPDRPAQFDACVLLAEDNAISLDLAGRMLAKLGCRVVPVADGAAAVQRAAEEPFDLVLIDCEMPVLDGFAATSRIRQQEAVARLAPGSGQRRRPTPIIALTAHTPQDVRGRCLAAGMDDVLGKPLHRARLIAMLQRWLLDAPCAPPCTAAPEPEDGTIDTAVIDEIRQLSVAGGTTLLARVVAQFEAMAPQLAATIRSTGRTGDTEALWRAAHRLRSAAATLGADTLVRRTGAIERSARESGTLPAGSELDSLDAELAAAIRVLRDLSGATA